MPTQDKVLVCLHEEVKSPPFSPNAGLEAGGMLRRLQRGERFAMPHSRPMRIIGPRCHELRVVDRDVAWRIVYRVDSDAIIILEVFVKKSNETPSKVNETCRQHLARYGG